ncbi:glutaredoxin family protein [Geobacillus stearothermophilus]|uniref:glutaredoxin family protein n=1 Tax=Geobacillus stearothermophilus TaxID=1422 RepID=UPI002E1A1B40|nr:glutaredoxin family protein [Geobacillus stearothermophilus]
MDKEILVYSSNNCSFCAKLKSWLDENNIPYINRDVDIPEIRKEFEKFNIHGIPVIFVTDKNTDKTTRIIGFQPDTIKKVLEL